MSFGVGNCPVTFARMFKRCERLDPCEVADKLGMRFPADDILDRPHSDFFFSYLGIGLKDPRTGKNVASLTLGWHDGQLAITPQPLAGRADYNTVMRAVARFVRWAKERLFEFTDRPPTEEGRDWTDELNAILEQLPDECERALKRTVEGSELGTHPWTGATGVVIGHHGAYTDRTYEALWRLLQTCCSLEQVSVFSVGWSAKARPRNAKEGYDVLTFVVLRSNVMTKGNWAFEERKRLYEFLSERLDVDLVGSLGEVP